MQIGGPISGALERVVDGYCIVRRSTCHRPSDDSIPIQREGGEVRSKEIGWKRVSRDGDSKLSPSLRWSSLERGRSLGHRPGVAVVAIQKSVSERNFCVGILKGAQRGGQ